MGIFDWTWILKELSYVVEEISLINQFEIFMDFLREALNGI